VGNRMHVTASDAVNVQADALTKPGVTATRIGALLGGMSASGGWKGSKPVARR